MLQLDEEFIHSIIEKYHRPINKLNLSNNGLQDIQAIQLLPELIKLNISKNQLRNEDLKALTSLSVLTELNLAENQISDLQALQALHQMEALDVSGNNLHDMQALEAIKHMPRLFSLQLKGNPICLQVYYPYEIFLLQPSLQYVDSWSRDQVLPNEEKRASLPSASLPAASLPAVSLPASSSTATAGISGEPVPSSGSNPSLTSSQKASNVAMPSEVVKSKPVATANPMTGSTVYESFSPTKVQLLEEQVQALHDTLHVQEMTLSKSCPVDIPVHFLSKHLAASPLTSEAKGQKTLPATQWKQLLQEQQAHQSKLPYLQLLQQWRTSTLQQSIQQTLLEKECQVSYQQQRQERQHYQQQLNQYETQVIAWKQKSTSYAKQCQVLEAQLQDVQSQLLVGQQGWQQSQHKLQHHHLTLTSLVHYLQHFQTQAHQHDLQLQQSMLRMQSKLQQYERQLQQCQDRIQLLTVLWQEKDVQVRNSMAIVEMERRIQSHQLQDPTTSSSVVMNEGVELLLSDELQLSTDAETLLKTLFKQLDVDEVGLVDVDVLLQALMTKQYEAVEESVLTVIGNMLKKCLGWSRLQPFLQQLQTLLGHQHGNGKAIEITWGECLLLLLTPTPQTSSSSFPPRVALSREDLMDMSKHSSGQITAMGVDLFDFGCLPLHINLKQLSTSSVMSRSSANNGSNPEIQRLQQERAYLQQKLQQQSQQLIRIAEGIKSYFHHQITTWKVKAEDATFQFRNAELSLQQARQRIEELESHQDEVKRKYEDQQSLWFEEKQQLLQRLEALTTTTQQEHEQLITTLETKASQLTQEVQGLHREVNKKEVKCKALQRDVLRLQNKGNQQHEERQQYQIQVEKLTKELQRVRQDHDEVTEKAEEKYAKDRQDWLEDKQDLLLKVNSLQDQVLQLQSQLQQQQVEAKQREVEATKAEEHSVAMEEQKQQVETTTAGPQASQQAMPKYDPSLFQNPIARQALPTPSRSEQIQPDPSSVLYQQIRDEMNTIQHISQQLPSSSSSGAAPLPRKELIDSHLSKLIRMMDQVLSSSDTA